MFDKDIRQGGDTYAQGEWMKRFPQGEIHDPLQKKEAYLHYAFGKLGPELLDKGLISEQALADINTWASSESKLDNAHVTKIIVAKELREWKEQIGIEADNLNPQIVRDRLVFEQLKVAAELEGIEIEELPNGAIVNGEYIAGLGISDTYLQQAGKVVSQRLERLARKGVLTSSQVEAIFEEGGLVNHPAGNSMGILIPNKEAILEAAEQGNAAKLNVARLYKAAGIDKRIGELINDNQGDNLNKDAI